MLVAIVGQRSVGYTEANELSLEQAISRDETSVSMHEPLP